MPATHRRVFFLQPMLLLIVVLLGGASIWRVRSFRKANLVKPWTEMRIDEKPKTSSPKKELAPLQPPPALMPHKARETFDQCVQILHRVMLFPTDNDWEQSVRHPYLTMPRLRADNGRWRVIPHLPLQVGPKFGITDSLVVTTLRLKDGTHRSVAIEKKGDRLLLDWESFTGWCEECLEDIANNDSRKAYLVRVKVQTAAAKPPFPELSGLSLVLSHPAGRRVVNAHVSEKVLSKSMAAKTLTRTREGLFTLRVRAVADSKNHGWVLVEEVVCAGWITDE